MIESLLARPYWVIDILPSQVPENRAAQYSAFEQFCLKEPAYSGLLRRHAMLLLKLSCWYDIQACFADEDTLITDLPPDRLVSLVSESGRDLCFVLPEQKVLITLNRGDTYMTVYNPRKKLLHMLEQLALSEQLFIWQPPQEGSAEK